MQQSRSAAGGQCSSQAVQQAGSAAGRWAVQQAVSAAGGQCSKGAVQLAVQQAVQQAGSATGSAASDAASRQRSKQCNLSYSANSRVRTNESHRQKQACMTEALCTLATHLPKIASDVAVEGVLPSYCTCLMSVLLVLHARWLRPVLLCL